VTASAVPHIANPNGTRNSAPYKASDIMTFLFGVDFLVDGKFKTMDRKSDQAHEEYKPSQTKKPSAP
jgi:hypothetical protein